MIVIVSGEGPTDIGRCEGNAAVCEPPDFVPGEMAMLVDMMLRPLWGYSPLEQRGVLHVTKKELGRLSREVKTTALPGKKKDQGTAFYFKNSLALGIYATQFERQEACETIAVLFRDTDGTVSTERGHRQKKLSSMYSGFDAAHYTRGVPMLPKPKSEVWMLCATQKRPYQSCACLEDISGNDASPNSAKRQLDAALKARKTSREELTDMLADGRINPDHIDMPSFNEFRQRVVEVAQNLAQLPQPKPRHRK